MTPAATSQVQGLPPDLIVESPALVAAPLWRREPFLLFFPAGVLLSWAGVLHWLLHAIGVLEDYRPVFHAIVQVEGFLMCFAVGFLFTMIPRRTGSNPPAAWEMGVALSAPLVTSVAAWGQRWVVSQLAFMILAGTVIAFAVRRFLASSSRRRPPNAFVWIPVAMLMGIAGSVLTGAMGWLGAAGTALHDFGRGLLLQGMFTCLVLGVGSLALPLMTRGEAPPDGGRTPSDRRAQLVHLSAAVVLAASFWIDTYLSLRFGLLLRGSIVLAVLVGSARLHRLPRDAWNARVIWIAAWMLPLGSLIAALFPAQASAGLHVTFVGGFALLVLSVSTQVTLGHSGQAELMLGRPRAVAALAATILTALLFRVMMEFDPQRYFVWMAAASTLFLGGTLIWARFLIPQVIQRLRGEPSRP